MADRAPGDIGGRGFWSEGLFSEPRRGWKKFSVVRGGARIYHWPIE